MCKIKYLKVCYKIKSTKKINHFSIRRAMAPHSCQITDD